MNTPPIISVFGASLTSPGEDLYEEGVRCGALLADAGFAVMTGGYGGLMEAVSRGARDHGGIVFGATAPGVFPDRVGANPFVSHERPAVHLLDRIHDMTDLSAASIALPGSLGTLTELMAAWNLAFVARFSGSAPKPVIAVGDRWASLIDHLATTLEADRSLVVTVPTVDEAVKKVIRLVG